MSALGQPNSINRIPISLKKTTMVNQSKRKIQSIKMTSINHSTKKKVTPQIPLFAFKSWAPEIINARCAMIGFVSGKGYELITNNSIFTQPHVFESFFFTSILITIASLIGGNPRNQVIEKKPFTSKVEIMNGRMAMLGILFSISNYFIA